MTLDFRRFVVKKEITPPMLIAVVAVVVLILGVIGWKVFAPSSDSGSPDQLKAAKLRKKKLDGG